MSEDEHSADDGVREVKSPGHKQKPDAGEEAVLVRKRAKVLSLSSHPELLVGPLSSDSHLAEPALPKLLRTLSNAFVIKGDSSDLPRLLERYAQWAEDMQVRATAGALCANAARPLRRSARAGQGRLCTHWTRCPRRTSKGTYSKRAKRRWSGSARRPKRKLLRLWHPPVWLLLRRAMTPPPPSQRRRRRSPLKP
jgi:hypothetical protein